MDYDLKNNPPKTASVETDGGEQKGEQHVQTAGGFRWSVADYNQLGELLKAGKTTEEMSQVMGRACPSINSAIFRFVKLRLKTMSDEEIMGTYHVTAQLLKQIREKEDKKKNETRLELYKNATGVFRYKNIKITLTEDKIIIV